MSPGISVCQAAEIVSTIKSCMEHLQPCLCYYRCATARGKNLGIKEDSVTEQPGNSGAS